MILYNASSSITEMQVKYYCQTAFNLTCPNDTFIIMSFSSFRRHEPGPYIWGCHNECLATFENIKVAYIQFRCNIYLLKLNAYLCVFHIEQPYFDYFVTNG